MNINDLSDLHPEDIAKLKLLLQVFQANEAAAQPKRRQRTYLKGLVVDDVEDRKLKFAILAQKTFANAGYSNCIAHETILTAKKWDAKGFRIKRGEKAVKVRGLPLFHVTQVEPATLVNKAEVRQVTDEQVAAYLARQAAAKAAEAAEAQAAYGEGYVGA